MADKPLIEFKRGDFVSFDDGDVRYVGQVRGTITESGEFVVIVNHSCPSYHLRPLTAATLDGWRNDDA